MAVNKIYQSHSPDVSNAVFIVNCLCDEQNDVWMETVYLAFKARLH